MRKAFSLLVLFGILVLNTASSQNKINYPWLYYPQTKTLHSTDYCKKFNCTDTYYKDSATVVKNFHALFGGEYKGPFDTIRSAFYEVSVERKMVYPNKQFGATKVELSMNTDLRYHKKMLAELQKNYINPVAHNIVGDLLYTLTGRKYPLSKIVRCFAVGSELKIQGENLRYRYELDIINNWDIPKGTPITKFGTDDPNYKNTWRKAILITCRPGNTLLEVLVVDDTIGADPPKK